MKKDIHPDYHPVLFVDTGAEFEFASRSTMTSKETREIDGVTHYVIRLDISSASHPFYTGKQRFVDTAGRIDKFRSKYGQDYRRRSRKGKGGGAASPDADASAKDAPAESAEAEGAPGADESASEG